MKPYNIHRFYDYDGDEKEWGESSFVVNISNYFLLKREMRESPDKNLKIFELTFEGARIVKAGKSGTILVC